MSHSKLVFRDGTALVGASLAARPFTNLVVENGVIGDFDGNADDAEVVDLCGGFLLPGLIDCHVHFDLAAAPAAYLHWRRHALVRSLTCLHNGLTCLINGITSVRDLGCADHLVLDYADTVRRQEIVGPRVSAAGRAITITGGHFAEYARMADGPTDVRKAVREQLGAGATVIKIMTSGGISTPGNPRASQFTAEEIRTAVEEAHSRGVKVAAHAHSPSGINAALSGGVDTIEHAAFVDDETLSALADSGVTVVPTVIALDNVEPGHGIPDDTVRKSMEARDQYRDATRRAIEAGVRIAAGTDAGTALNPIGNLVEELQAYADFGMSQIEVLRAATVLAGDVVGGDVGVIEKGRPADLLALHNDPRTDLAHLRSPQAVVIGGRLLDLHWSRQTIQQLKDLVTA